MLELKLASSLIRGCRALPAHLASLQTVLTLLIRARSTTERPPLVYPETTGRIDIWQVSIIIVPLASQTDGIDVSQSWTV